MNKPLRHPGPCFHRFLQVAQYILGSLRHRNELLPAFAQSIMQVDKCLADQRSELRDAQNGTGRKREAENASIQFAIRAEYGSNSRDQLWLKAHKNMAWNRHSQSLRHFSQFGMESRVTGGINPHCAKGHADARLAGYAALQQGNRR